MSSTMRITFICFIVFSFESGNAGLQPISKQVSRNIDIAVSNIIGRCFKHIGDAVVFLGESRSILAANSTFKNSVAVVRIDDLDAERSDSEKTTLLSRKLPIFIITVSDGNTAERMITGIKKTHWWNNEGYYIMLDKRSLPTKHNCTENARDFMETAWKMDILSAMFLCECYTKEECKADSVVAYTYNPYKDNAPSPWKLVDTHASPEGHPWTLYSQTYDPNITTCNSLHFKDKTLDLNGYKICAEFKPYLGRMGLNSSGKAINVITGSDSRLSKVVWNKLNASVSLVVHDATDDIGDSFENGSSTGIIANLVHGKCDICLNLRYVTRQRGIHFTSIVSMTSMWIITNHRGVRSTLTKIADFVSIYVVVALFVVCLVIVIVTGCLPIRSRSPDFLNVLRLLVGTAIPRLPKLMSLRLLLLSAMLVVTVFNSALQGKVAALLTSRISVKQIDTLNEIATFNYTLYGYQFIADLIPPNVADRFYNPKIDHTGFCEEILENVSRAACLVGPHHVLAMMRYNQNDYKRYHISDSSANLYLAYATRSDWPLYRTFDFVLTKLFESGLTGYWGAPDISGLMKKRRTEEKSFRVVTLEELSFAFIILGTGLLVANVVFFIEIFVASYKPLAVIKPFPYIN